MVPLPTIAPKTDFMALQPMEKILWWDRIFNRTRREVIERGTETWTRTTPTGKVIKTYDRDFVVYKITHRVNGNETIEKKYLN